MKNSYQYRLLPELQFKKDYQKLKREHPELIPDLHGTFEELKMYGIVDEISTPHTLNNRGGNYNGNYEYHLSNGKVDVLVVYKPHKTNPIIRLIRIGTHKELFQGELK